MCFRDTTRRLQAAVEAEPSSSCFEHHAVKQEAEPDLVPSHAHHLDAAFSRLALTLSLLIRNLSLELTACTCCSSDVHMCRVGAVA